jgi:hypothetical protein
MTRIGRIKTDYNTRTSVIARNEAILPSCLSIFHYTDFTRVRDSSGKPTADHRRRGLEAYSPTPCAALGHAQIQFINEIASSLLISLLFAVEFVRASPFAMTGLH